MSCHHAGKRGPLWTCIPPSHPPEPTVGTCEWSQRFLLFILLFCMLISHLGALPLLLLPLISCSPSNRPSTSIQLHSLLSLLGLQGRLPWLLYQGGSSGWGDWGTALPPMHLATQFSACEGVDFQRNSILSEVCADGCLMTCVFLTLNAQKQHSSCISSHCLT